MKREQEFRVRLTRDEKRVLWRLARREDITASQWMRRAIRTASPLVAEEKKRRRA